MGELLARFKSRFAAPPVDSMKDWPDALRVNAAASTLAPVLYDAFYSVTNNGYAPWQTLHHAVKHQWIKRAELAIRSVR